MHVKKGDTVMVVAGKDKGAVGKVIAAFPTQDRVIVEGVNLVKKHTKIGQSQRGAKTGGILTQEAPIHISNVMLVDADTKKPTRVGFRKETVDKTRADGSTYSAERNVRVAKRSGEDI